jgi:hypothetical protein
MVVAASVVGGVVRKQRQIVAQFRQSGVTSADRAASPATLGIDEGMAFRILRRHAILVAVGERYYLDEPGWEAHRARRRRLAAIIPGVVLLAGFVVLWIVLR